MKHNRIMMILAGLMVCIATYSQPFPPATTPPAPPTQTYGQGWTGQGFGPEMPMWGTSPGMMTGGQWGPGTFTGPINDQRINFNNGISHVVGVGYDAQGVWETVPLVVRWHWNGVNYDVTVLTAWNPWTHAWDGSLDMSAFQTQYTLRGIEYDYYVNLSTGTYYFNL